MKRTCLISSALAVAVLAPTSASAEPSILYIPTEAVTLNGEGCGTSVNSGLGCTGGMTEAEEPAFAGAADLTTALEANLAAYDVFVTNTRPPEYIAYTMMLPSDEPLDAEAAGIRSFTCVFGGINCSALLRNDIVSTSGTTDNCLDPEIVHAAMYAFGRVSGLEGVANPEDWMNYVLDAGPLAGPDYATPPMGYQDLCNDRVPRQGFDDRDMQVSLPLQCTSLDQFGDCPDDMGGNVQQNSHANLMEYYGANVVDADAPELMNIMPEDATVLMQGEDLVLDVDISDADPIAGARWVITSPALEEAGIEGGFLDQCTNAVCGSEWNDASPFKATDSDWIVTIPGLPAGEYVITLEAADYHGNVAEMVTINVTIEGTASDTTGDAETGNGDMGDATSGAFTTGADSGDTGNGSGQSDDDGGTDGCACTSGSTPTRGGAALMFLGLLGLGAMRRRW